MSQGLIQQYPQDNIIFEDSTEAVLIQNRCEAMRCPVDDLRELAHSPRTWRTASIITSSPYMPGWQ